jgi:nucleoside-diphosphate-sugar epimerase
MKVLVTGASGFTGSNLAQKLVEQGDDVSVLIRDRSKIPHDLQMNVEVHSGDIRDTAVVKRATKNIETIYHLAAVFRTPGIRDQTYWDIHVEATKNLLKAGIANDAECFVHCSTVGVHGHVKRPPANEQSPFKPGDIYQLTKLKGELAALQIWRDTGFPVTVIRPTAIYGPGDMRLLKLFKLASRSYVPILGSGNIYYHMVYIDDLVDAFMQAAENHKELLGESFIVGSENHYTLNELIDVMAESMGRKAQKIHLPATPFQLIGSACEKICIPLGINPPIYRRRVDFFTKSRSFDISKAKRMLKFKPKVAMVEGISKTAKWYHKNNYL